MIYIEKTLIEITSTLVPPGIFSDLLGSVQMLKRDKVRKATGSYRTYSIPRKTAALVPEFVVGDLPSSEL